MASRDRLGRAERLKRLVDIAAADERRAGMVVGRLNAEVETQNAQLQELNTFRRDYAARSSGLSGSQSAHWKDYQDFLGRLDGAVRAQQQVVSDAESGVEAARQRWIVKRQRLESLRKVEERARQEESTQRERREQRVIDDLARNDSPFGTD